MTVPHAYWRFLNSLSWDGRKDIIFSFKMDARLHKLLKDEAKREGYEMTYIINTLIAKWLVRRIKKRGARIVERIV